LFTNKDALVNLLPSLLDVYVCMHVCMYIYIYTHTHRHTHTHKCGPQASAERIVWPSCGLNLASPGVGGDEYAAMGKTLARESRTAQRRTCPRTTLSTTNFTWIGLVLKPRPQRWEAGEA